MNKWLSTGLAALAAGWAFAGSASAEELTLKCAYPFWPGFAPVHLAQELGYFEEEGLTVAETFDDDRGNVLPALERGDIGCDMRTVGEHQGRPRTPETQGRIIGTIDISMGGDGVLVRERVVEQAARRARLEPLLAEHSDQVHAEQERDRVALRNDIRREEVVGGGGVVPPELAVEAEVAGGQPPAVDVRQPQVGVDGEEVVGAPLGPRGVVAG